MKTRMLRSFTLSASLLVFTVEGMAFMAPERGPLPNLDSRTDQPQAEAAPSAEQGAAVELLRSQLPGARVDFEPVTGAPRLVSAGEHFLSGENGEGRGVSSGVAAGFGSDDPHRATKAFLREHAGLFGHGPEALDLARVAREYTTPHTGLKTVVWEQQVDGIPVFEAVLVSHTTRKGELVNLSSQFLPDPTAAADRGVPNRAAQLAAPKVTARQAVALAAQNVGEDLPADSIEPVDPGAPSAVPAGPEQRQEFKAAALNGPAAAKLVWLPLSRARLDLCWDVVLTSRTRPEMYRVLVQAQTGQVLVRRCLTDYLSDGTYRVYTSDSPSPFSPGHPTPASTQPPEVPRALLTFGALSTNASPNGWMDDGVNETRGNNVDAHTDRNNDNLPDLPRPQGSPSRVFDFTLDLAQGPTTYSSAAVVQLFYWNNFMHDKLYDLGFTEAAGNFQNDNYARGGLGYDAVQADAQDGGGYNNANFSTPPDGFPGRMQMYIFNGPTPDRDGDLDAEVVLHEYTHGLSNRRVGGGLGLSVLQSRGMGEGWSDFYALALLSEPGDDVDGVYASGSYVTYLLGGLTQNYYYGIRRYPYCTDLSRNPLTFKDIDPAQASTHPGVPRSPIIGSDPSEVHNMGEVWCMALWEVRAGLVRKHGGAAGNQLILQLVTDGMNLSPANPNFLQARDAILQADQVATGGANRTELWTAFAKRGMGYTATSPASGTTTGLHEAYDVPDPLVILPATVSASGPPGGPFTPNPAYFVVTNTGSNTLTWSLASTSLWVNLSPTGGSLPAGAAASVAVTVTAAANSFSPGIYNAGLRFTNESSGLVQSASFALAVVGRRMWDDFDPGVDLSQWSGFGGTIGSTVLATNYGGSVSGPNSLWFGDNGSRYAVTLPINTTSGGFISFSLRLANGSAWPWEIVDLPGEGVVLECSTNNSATWTVLSTYNTTAYYNWTAVSLGIPPTAQAPATLFRWRQLSHGGTSFDHWALDDVFILAEDMAPQITSQPQDQTVPVGDPVTLSVTAFGTQPLSYQWRKDGTNLNGATASSLAWTSVQLTDAGTYSVSVSNRLGGLVSSDAVLSVYVPVCAQPTSGLVSWWTAENDPADVLGLNPGTLQGGATYARGRVGQAFSFDPANGTVLVPDSPSLRLTNQLTIEAWINARNASGNYGLVCKDGGAGGNNGYQLDLVDGTIQGLFNSPGTTWPSQRIASGRLITEGLWYHVAFTYDQSAMVLYCNGQPVATNVIGAKAIAASVSNLRISGDDNDHCYFDGLIDEVAVYNRALSASEIAEIYHAANAGKCRTPTPPSIATQPQSRTVAVGTSVNLAVVAAGTVPLSYEWRFNGTNIAAATGSVLAFASVQFTDAGSYDVIVTNLFGSTNSAVAVLTVLTPPQITGQPQDQTVGVGSNASFTVTATGSSPLAYQWYFNGAALSAATSSALVLNGVSLSQAGSYRVLVSNPVGSVWSRTALLTVVNDAPCAPPPAGLVGWWAGEGNPIDSAGLNTGTLQGAATYAPGLVGQAFSFDPANGTVVVPDSPSLRLTNQLTIETWINTRRTNTTFGLVCKDGGAGGNNGYQLVLVNNTIQGLFNSPGQGWPSAVIASGGIIGTGAWYHVAFTYDQSAMKLYCNGQPVATNVIGAKTIAASSSRLRISGDDNNQCYFDGLIDEPAVYNRALSPAEIAGIYNAGADGKCWLPPSLLAQPQDCTVTAGFTTTFGVRAGGTPPLSYQWQLDGSPIPGETLSSLTLTNIQLSQAGSYCAAVSNAVASVTSSNALLTVLPLPPCVTPSTGLVSWWRAEGNANDSAALNNGTLQGTATYVPGLVGQAFSFNPASGTVVVPDSPSLRLTNQLTIEAWINTRRTNTTFGLVCKDGGAGGNNGYQLVLVNNTIQGLFNSPGQGWPSALIASGGIIGTGVWYHVAFTYDQSAMKLYCNGQPVATNVIGAKTIAASSSRLRISGDDNNQCYFDGLIDEPAVYNRALSASEIAGIYNAGVVGKCGLAPAVQTPPQNQTIECSSNVTFSVTATGMLPLSYQWRFGLSPIPGATNTLLSLANVGFAQAGSYSVVISNAYGSATGGPAVLTVVDTLPPTIMTCAANRTLSAVAECAALLPDLTGEVVASDPSGPVTVAQYPSPGALLNLGATNILFTVRDSSGNAASCSCAVTVDDLTPPVIVSCVSNLALSFDTNCQALLPDLTGTNYVLASDNCSPVTVAQVPPVQTPLPAGTNTVWLTVSDSASNQTTCAVAVVVRGEPNIASQPAHLSAAVTSNATFSVTACGTSPLAYQWRHAGTNLPAATNAVLTLSNIKTNDCGDYWVTVTNSAGSITSSVATLTVLQPPVITRQPRSVIAAPGATASFTVAAKGLTPLAYQWQKAGTPLAGQTRTTLTIANIAPEDFASYTVGITNADGGVLSAVATLTLATSPVLCALSFNSSTFMLTVPTEAGPTYVLECKDSLDTPEWRVLTTVTGTGSPIALTDNGLTNTMRFYRVRVR